MAEAALAARHRERLSTDFDLQDFCKRYGVSKADVGTALETSQPTIYQWTSRKTWPLSAYKAVIVRFAPDDAERCEARQTVAEQKMPFMLTPVIKDLADRYDVLRAGNQIALANGQGFYKIPRTDTPLTLVEGTDDSAEQDLLLQIIARITGERNVQAIELAHAKQAIRDRDAQLKAANERIQQLQRSIKEWEQLAERATAPLPPTPTDVEARVADRVVELLKRKAPSLVGELDRINPPRGRLHS